MLDVFEGGRRILSLGIGSWKEETTKVSKKFTGQQSTASPTQRHVVIALYGNVLGLLHIVDAFQDGKAMADTGNAHGL